MGAVQKQLEPAGTAVPPERFASSAIHLGALTGALAGLWVALGDYGATWLWLPLWRDRGGLFLRLLGALAPVGALLGALCAALSAVTLAWAAKKSSRPERLFPLPFVVLALWPLRLLAVKLCSGGSMARLSFHDALEWSLTVCFPLGLYVALWLLARLRTRVLDGAFSPLVVGAALLGLSFGLGKVNQTVLPNLYEYLHATLALVAWLCAWLGFLAFSLTEKGAAAHERWLAGARLLGSYTALTVALLATALTLNTNLNVRVAMFDARAPTSRALLAAVDPLLSAFERRNQGQAGKKGLVRADRNTAGLPTQEGAHVVLITIDALRADHLGLYGYGRPVSPGLDALAEKAAVFERAYCQAPHSSYSLSSLHTSEYLHEVVDLAQPLPEATLATTLKQHGYHTAAFFTNGIFHTEGARLAVYRDSAFGFDLFDHTNRESEHQTDRVLQEVERIKAKGEPPSFLWVHYFDVHEPYQETTFGTGEMDRYDSEIAHVDRELTRLLRELEARFEREVIVVITADHGEEFREHGGVYHGSTLYDEQVRVPLIIKAAALPPTRFPKPVEVIDVAPTLLGLVGVPVPSTMRGRDLRAFALGRTKDPGPVFSAVLTKRMALKWPYKLIADLRFNLFELYDLERDPNERKNLAGSSPEVLAELKGFVYAWLDSLERAPDVGHGVADVDEEWSRALRWGRLGDRRAVEPVSRLLLDERAPTEMRIEGGQILAKLADPASAEALVKGMETTPPEVAAEAAIALGRMYDQRAAPALRKLVHVEDPFVRARAAVSLGRLRDRAAVPALIDALWVAPSQYEREEAVRWLGRLRDRRAVEPLLSIVSEFNLRYLVVVSLGQIGDPRCYDALIRMLDWERHTNIRDNIVRGLGTLGDPRAAPALVRILETETGLKNTSESLIRLGALERGLLGGLDFHPGMKGESAFAKCHAGPLFHDWEYLERTYCTSRTNRVELKLPLPKGLDFQHGADLLVRVRRSDSSEPVSANISAGGAELATKQLDEAFVEHRFALGTALLEGDVMPLTIEASEADARIAIDHAIVVPKRALLADSDTPEATDDAAKMP